MFYGNLVKEAKAGKNSIALRNAFKWILGKSRPQCAAGVAWIAYVGNHKSKLLAVLGVKGKNIIHQTEWDMDDLLDQTHTTSVASK